MDTYLVEKARFNHIPYRKIRDHLNRFWAIWAWIALLGVVNWPLWGGQVRVGLLFFPDDLTGGHWWRLITHPLVHLSWYHLLLDAGGFLVLYPFLEAKHPLTKVFYLIGPCAGAVLLSLGLDPALARHGLAGLSGVAHGVMAISALEMMRHKEQRFWAVACLTSVVLKSAYEVWAGHVVFEFMHMGLCGIPLATSHAGGVIGGLITFAVVRGAVAGIMRLR